MSKRTRSNDVDFFYNNVVQKVTSLQTHHETLLA